MCKVVGKEITGSEKNFKHPVGGNNIEVSFCSAGICETLVLHFVEAQVTPSEANKADAHKKFLYRKTTSFEFLLDLGLM
jgi:hypothetical protein